MPIVNDTSSESSWRDVAKADLFGIDTIPTAVEISTMENIPWHRCIRQKKKGGQQVRTDP